MIKACCFILLFILATAPAVIFATISVSPTLYELQIPRGQSYTDAIRVMNVGKVGIILKVYLSDFDFQVNGDIRFPDAGTTKYSLANYLRLNPTSLDLEPNEEKIVRFTITMPQDLEGEFQGIIFFQTQPKGIKTPSTGKQVLISTRIGAGIYAAAKHTVNNSSEILGLFFKQAQAKTTPPPSPQSDNSSFHYALLYHNNGNIHLRPTGKVKVLDAAGKEMVSAPINENNASVLGDSVRIFEGDFKNMPAFSDGTYKIVAEVDYGKEILEAEKPIYLLNSGGIESFEAKLTPKENNVATIVFNGATKGIPHGKENEPRKKVFRIKSATGELQGELLANTLPKAAQEKYPQIVEYTGEWHGQLKPGLYFAEFLIFLRENEVLTSFCLIDNTGGSVRAAGD